MALKNHLELLRRQSRKQITMRVSNNTADILSATTRALGLNKGVTLDVLVEAGLEALDEGQRHQINQILEEGVEDGKGT